MRRFSREKNRVMEKGKGGYEGVCSQGEPGFHREGR